MAGRIVCWNCGANLDEVPRPISRHASCPACFNDLHCCRLCRHYHPTITHRCDEDRADPPVVKENANFCDWFRPQAGAFEAKTEVRGSQAQGALDALFAADKQADESEQENADHDKTDAVKSAEDIARDELEKLFGKDVGIDDVSTDKGVEE